MHIFVNINIVPDFIITYFLIFVTTFTKYSGGVFIQIHSKSLINVVICDKLE